MYQRSIVVIIAGLALAGAASMVIRGQGSEAKAAGPYHGTPDDFMDISQLFSRYDNGIDNGNGAAWADNFTPDGVFQDPSTCAIGREQLMAVANHDGRPDGDQEHFHMPSLGPIVYIDRDHATVHSTVVVVRKTGFGIQGGILVTGSYDDTLIRSRGKWLFSYRLVHRPNGDKPPVECSAPKSHGEPSAK
jgi:SnoaL-like domain